MNNTFRVISNTPIANERLLPAVPQNQNNHRREGRQSYSRALASFFISGVLAFTAGTAISTTDIIDYPAEMTAAILLEITNFN